MTAATASYMQPSLLPPQAMPQQASNAAAADQPQSSSGTSGGTFSPLTMFECTISSATMLIDSMAVRDLLVAFKIVAQLHDHLFEVLDPTVQRLANVADEHSMCPTAVAASDNSAMFSPIGGGGGGGISVDSKHSPQPPCLPPAGAAAEDCVLLEEAEEMSAAVAAATAASARGQAPKATSISMTMIGGGGGGGGGGSERELSNEWKATLRKAYRVLKDETGTDVFDFSLPYSAGANVRAAQRVMDRSLGLCRERPANAAAWQSLAGAYVHRWFRCNLKPTAKRAESQMKISATFSKMRHINSKLARRRRAYEAIKPQLDEDTRAKTESVALSRDYTSSDEECASSGDLLVRALPWESAELRQLKRRLDDVVEDHPDSSATSTAAAAEEAPPPRPPAAARRESGIFSARPPPSDGADWAKTMAPPQQQQPQPQPLAPANANNSQQEEQLAGLPDFGHILPS